MDKDFYTNDFEQLLRERTEEYKMYPSESVWSNIFNKLHPGRRWGIIGGSVLLLLFTATVLVLRTNNKNTVTQKESPAEETKAPVTNTVITQSDNNEQNTVAIQTSANNKTAVKRKDAGVKVFASSGNAVLNTNSSAHSTALNKEHKFSADNSSLRSKNYSNKVYSPVKMQPFELLTGDNSTLGFTKAGSKTGSNSNNISLTGITGYAYPVTKINIPKQSKFEWQLYFTPSVSYRKLFKNDNPANRYFAYNNFIPGTSPDNKVEQTPALGFEVGNAIMYAVSGSLKLKAGVQFNYSKYNIRAYTTNPEPATIRLAGSGFQTEIISVQSNLKTSGSYFNATNISSQNTALSFPLGADLKLMGNNRVSWAVAGTLQPTIILNNKAYIVTNDLKNYVRNADVFRSFVMNSALETYLKVERGNGVALQIGPQFRYQISSSYTQKYTISEHLIEYGLKVGIIKRL